MILDKIEEMGLYRNLPEILRMSVIETIQAMATTTEDPTMAYDRDAAMKIANTFDESTNSCVTPPQAPRKLF